MVEGPVSRDALMGVFLKHPHQQVKRLGGQFRVDFFVESEIAGSILGEYLIVFFPLEDRAAQEQVVEDDPG